MARTRNIKPAFFDNDILGDLSPLTRLLFIGLWCIADREGRLEDRPRRIRKALLGYDDVSVEDVDAMLDSLAEHDFIIRYAANGESYIQVTNFRKHQNPHMKERESEIPPPPDRELENSDEDEGDAERYEDSDEDRGEDSDEDREEKPGGAQKKAPDVKMSETQTERFARFWAQYPNKKAKRNALDAWRKLKPNAALFEKIMTAVGAAKQSEEWMTEGGRYIPHPATWLNGGRWDDEPPEVTRTVPPRARGGASDTLSVLRSIIASEEGGGYNDEIGCGEADRDHSHGLPEL